MRRIRAGRAALGAVTVALALFFGVFAAGGAQASTTAAGSAVAASVSGPIGGCDAGAVCTYNSPWMYYGEGSCEVSTTVTFYPATNRMTVNVVLDNPYWFAGCTVWSTVYFNAGTGTDPGASTTYSGGSFYAYACGLQDWSCYGTPSGSGEWTYTDVATGIPTNWAQAYAEVHWIQVTDAE
jgi:hypothetical protein